VRFCWAQYLLWLVIAVLGVGAAVSGCGQKGDLYLPEPPAQEQAQEGDRAARR
jgi:predicted small lipoprotein YifL